MILSVKQKERIAELKERIDYIDEIVLEKISDHSQPLPLNLILEARFNVLMITGIKLEAELKYLEEQGDEDLEGVISVKRRRLDMIKGQINELNNVADMLNKYDSVGREFEIIRV
ncbi:hypothetical protein [Bacillus andreraoultii]|uniref:hypothetical protein n=1 Tax=Bacillus andreraoultii TaxID=1499685 RepID=UPI00053A45F5|nr:hypothetical protein [Bacillus andreraoultii]